MALELIRLLIGQAPLEYQNLEYVTATIVGIFTLKFIYEMFNLVFNLVTKR